MSWTNPKPAICIIFLWSLAVHLPGLHSPMLDYHAYRQCQTASMARNYARHGMHFLTPELDTSGIPRRAGTEFPIYSYLLAILFKLFGTHEIYGRGLSMFFAAWGAIYLYRFVKRRLGEGIAVWSALVLCSSPVHIYFTRSVQPESMALWGLLGFLYHFDQWLNVHRKASDWLLAIALGSIAPLLKLPYFYILAAMWIYLGFERNRFKSLLQMASLSVMACIVAFTGLWYTYARTAPVTILPLGTQAHLDNLAPVLTLNLWRAQFISRVPELVTTYSGLILAALGFYYYRRAKALPLFLFWSAAGILYVPLLGEYGMIHRYTLLPLAPIAAVWIACGISMVWESARTHALMRIVALLLIVGIPVHAGLRIKHWYRVEYQYIDRAHATLLRVAKPKDLVLVSSHEAPELIYYLDHYGYAVEPNAWQPEEVARLLHKGVRFILIPEEDNRPTLAKWKSYLKTRARLIEDDPDYLLYQLVDRHG